jgi:hypothetical protein
MLALAETMEDWMPGAYPRAAKVIRGCSRRKTGFSNSEVQVLWMHGFEASNSKGSLWSDGVKLYSYYTPIAVKCRNAVLVNTHFYSPTTCHHRPWVRYAVEVDFEILRRWVAYKDLEELYVLDVDDDAVLLFKDSGDNHYILMLRDEGREYGVKLPTPCRTVSKAKEMLLPREALAAVKEGRRVSRQGEWYFIAFPEMRFPREAVEHLLRDRRWRDKHLRSHIPRDKVAWCFSVEEARCSRYFQDSTVYVFVRGTVRHARGDHRMLRLGETWHLAVRSPLRGVTATRGLD